MTENHRPQPSTEELLAVLHATRNSVTSELLKLKHEVRERQGRIQVLEHRLAETEQSQHDLEADA
jgi:hypothetical protein